MKEKPFYIRNIAKPIIIIIVLTAIVYANSLKNSFISDDFAIVENDFVKSWKNFPLIFSRSYLTFIKDATSLGIPKADLGAGEVTYRPVGTLSYFIDYSIWKLNPFGYHLTNLLLHIFNVVLLYFFITLVTGNTKIALFSSLLFALHPINTEAVDIIAFRKDLLVFLFFISSFILYILLDNYSGIKKTRIYILSLLLFLLALFSKEMAVTLPIMLFLYDYYFVFKGKIRKILTKFKSYYLGYLVILLFYLWIWGVVMRNPNPMSKYPGGNFYTNILTMSGVVVYYIKWIFMPIDVHFIFSASQFILYGFTPKVLLSFLLIAVCLVAAIRIYKRSKEMSFSIVWFFVTLLPVSNIFPLRNIVGGRYLYIPIVGFCLFLPLLQLKLFELNFLGISRSVLKIINRDAIVIILIFYSIFTMIRNVVYKNDISGWLEIIEWYPNNFSAHVSLGNAFLRGRLLDKAIGEFKIATVLRPHNGQVHYLLGCCYDAKGKKDDAILEYKKALELEPNFVNAYSDLAALYFEMGKIDEAIQLWNKVIERDPNFVIAHSNLSLLYFQKEQYDLAIKHYDKAIELGVKIDQRFLKLLEPYRNKAHAQINISQEKK